MKLMTKTANAVEVKIVGPFRVCQRLEKTCFRGKEFNRAGNFCLWDNMEDLLKNPLILPELLAEADEHWRAKDFTTFSICIEYPKPVGWESTAPQGNYDPSDLEYFEPTHRSSGLRVKLDRREIKAPATNLVTVIYEFRPDRDEPDLPVAIVHSIYPGQDIGEMVDNVTERENRIFFDFKHPGEKTAKMEDTTWQPKGS